MATRKRKKRNPSDGMQRIKPELLFVESPIDGCKHYCTPVQAARNPFMAPSIPVEDLSAKWISPQFPQNTTPEMKDGTKRRTKRSKHGKQNSENVRTKLVVPPLNFEDKLQSTSEGEPRRVGLRHSTRIKNKEHFLFEDRHWFTPQQKQMKVLVCETPEDSGFPVVLRKLRKHLSSSDV